MKNLFALGAGLAALFAFAGAESFPSNFDEAGGWTSITGEFRVAPESKILEKTLGAPDFVKIRNLPQNDPNVALSRKVGQFIYLPEDQPNKSSVCSGSLVGPNLFLTNHHCIVGEGGGTIAIGNVYIAMEHVSEGEVGPRESLSGVRRVAASNENLDYALLELTVPLGERYGWLELERDPAAVTRERAVKIIQHPSGRSKEIVTNNTEVVKVSNPWLHYLADTEGGSSGSPVFAVNGEKIIALHHAGIKDKYNEGVVISFIANEIAAFLPVGAVASKTADQPAAQQPSAPAARAAEPPAKTAAADAPAKPAEQPASPAQDPAANGGWVAITGE